ncbi:sortase [Cryobacterium serini]|uniref:Sortase n=2 Tax=Cryobacterium serini TaxID=1259201 RepID=A0A4R9BSX1_9MICO|nr:sortase [Cryobacterium serini]
MSEILTLVGLIIGAVLYIVGLSVRGISGRWTRTTAVIAASGPATVIRWFDNDGDVHECPADTHETQNLVAGDDVRVWFRNRWPEKCRTHDPDLDGKGLRLIGLVLLGIGVLAGVAGIVLMFL